jgi:hypothetical protein
MKSSRPDESLPARSLAEVYLYLMVTPCAACEEGALRAGDAKTRREAGRLRVEVAVECGTCGRRGTQHFELPAEAVSTMRQNRIGPDASLSRIIDVAQWLTLFRMIVAAADRQTNKTEARRLGYEAAQCLDEALKFYTADHDLPPDTAFFSEQSRSHRREHPEFFARPRLLELRAKLPALHVMERKLRAPGKPARGRRWRLW